MPLLRIDLPRSIPPARRTAIADIIDKTLIDVLNTPVGGRFHIISAHDSNSLQIDPTFLDIDRWGRP